MVTTSNAWRRPVIWTGREDVYLEMPDRAHRAHLEGSQTSRAVRCAFWLGLGSEELKYNSGKQFLDWVTNSNAGCGGPNP